MKKCPICGSGKLKKGEGLGYMGHCKKIKVVRSGDSLAIRIPAEIAKLFNLHEGKEIFLYPEGTTKLALEIK